MAQIAIIDHFFGGAFGDFLLGGVVFAPGDVEAGDFASDAGDLVAGDLVLGDFDEGIIGATVLENSMIDGPGFMRAYGEPGPYFSGSSTDFSVAYVTRPYSASALIKLLTAFAIMI